MRLKARPSCLLVCPSESGAIITQGTDTEKVKRHRKARVGNSALCTAGFSRCEGLIRILDHNSEYSVIVWTGCYFGRPRILEMKLTAFRDYYNRYRGHHGLKGETPVAPLDSDVVTGVSPFS